MNPIVTEFLKNKYGDSYEKDAESKFDEERSSINTGRLISNLGDALGGRSVGSQNEYFGALEKQAKENTIGKTENARKNAMQDMQFTNEMAKNKRESDMYDPNSAASVTFRKNLEANFPRIAQAYGDNWANVSAGDQESIFKPLQLKEQMDARRQQAEILAGSRRDAQNVKVQEKEDKKKQQMFEIEDRRQNINSNLSALQKMIDDDGTFEMFGSHNADMDRLVDQIATDMAKLQDPSSVARPNEVEMVKKNLVKAGTLGTRNSTAKDQLANFANEVNRRADSAYKIRGMDAPNSGYEKDVLDYAQAHGISPQAAYEQKMRRSGQAVGKR